jgi:ribosomal protein S18 acetylase RimI-like enzyme
VKIDEASVQDEAVLGKIAEKIFKTDHFHSDPFLSTFKSNELYVRWTVNSLHGMADTVLVARKGATVLGFITCKICHLSQNYVYGDIDLVGVLDESRGKGSGTLLVSEALKWFRKKVPSVYVGTQAGNLRAMRLYSKLGFKPVYSEATMHLWVS